MPCLGLELLEEKKLFKLTYNGIVYYIIYKHMHGCVCKGVSYRSADPGLRQGRGGAWDHRRCGPGTLQNLPSPPNTVPSRHPTAKATSQTGTPGPRPQQWLSMGFQSCRLPARKRSKPSKPSKPSKLSKTLQTLQTLSPAGTPGPRPLPEQAPQGQGHSNGFLLAFKAAVCQPANAPNPPKPSKPSKPPKTLQTLQTPSKTLQTLQTPSPAGTPGPRPLPQQAPQGQGHSIAFYGLSKLPFASPQTLQTFQSLPNTVPSRDPRAKNAPNPPKPSKLSKPPKTLQTLQTPSKTLQTLQTPSPAGTPGPRPLPQQAPQGQGHSIAFYGLSKLPFASPQTLQTFQNLPNPPNPPKLSKPSKHRPQQGPQGQGHFPNRHPRAKATAMAFYWLSKLPFASPQTLQTLQNPPNPPKPSKPSKHPPKPSKPSKTFQTFQTPSKPSKHPPKPSKPSKHLPQQAPQGQGHFSNRHPRAKATA